MTNKKTTKRALLVSLVSMLLCFAMLLGTTFAWFTDSASSANNVIKAGNLDIKVEYTLDGENWADLDSAEDLFQKGLWEPGHTEVAALKITNAGSLALKYAVNMNVTSETVGKTKDGKDIVLSEILTVSTLCQEANDIGEAALALAFSGENSLAYAAPTTFKAGNVLGSDAMLTPGAAHYMFVKVDMPEGVGNEANHDGVNIPEINFGINVLATQLAYEEDSFGKDYDAGAEYPAMMTASGEAELKDAVNNAKAGDTVKLTNDVTIDGYAATEKLIIDKAITLDLNGNTITTECGWGGIDAKGGCSIKNGTINHTGNTAAIKAFQVAAIENVTINVTETEGKVKGGIVVQEGAGCYIGSIKDVTINGATNGIETFRCGKREDLAIGSMENVIINATGTGMLLSAPVGTATNCVIEGDNVGINMYLYGPYSVSINLVGCTVTGATAVYAHDEVNLTNPGSLTLTYDTATEFFGDMIYEFEEEVLNRVKY